MNYQLVKNNKAGDKILKNGKFVSNKDVPEVWQRILRNQDIFTGEPATHKRLVQGIFVPLSDDSYYGTTVGQIVAELRKGEDNVHEEKPE